MSGGPQGRAARMVSQDQSCLGGQWQMLRCFCTVFVNALLPHSVVNGEAVRSWVEAGGDLLGIKGALRSRFSHLQG